MSRNKWSQYNENRSRVRAPACLVHAPKLRESASAKRQRNNHHLARKRRADDPEVSVPSSTQTDDALIPQPWREIAAKVEAQIAFPVGRAHAASKFPPLCGIYRAAVSQSSRRVETAIHTYSRRFQMC